MHENIQWWQEICRQQKFGLGVNGSIASIDWDSMVWDSLVQLLLLKECRDSSKPSVPQQKDSH